MPVGVDPTKPKKIQCPECDGSKQVPTPTGTQPCPDCSGTGYLEAVIVKQ